MGTADPASAQATGLLATCGDRTVHVVYACWMRTTLTVLLVGFLAASGCKKDVTKDIEGLADRACACTDVPCAEKVVDDLLALADKNRDADGDKDRAQTAARRIGECVMKTGMDQQKFLDKMKQLQAMDQ